MAFQDYQLSDLRSICLRLLRVGNTVRHSPTEGTADYDWIDDALNRGLEQFVRKTKCLKTYGVLELLANYRNYRMPQEFLDLKNAFYYDASLSDGYRELIIKNVEEMDEEFSDYRTKTGSPTHIYIDELWSNQWVVGLYPIPDESGGAISFGSTYGAAVEYQCPLYTYGEEYGIAMKWSGNILYLYNDDDGVVEQISTMDKNVRIEFYRLPIKLEYADQYPDIPKEYRMAICYFAAHDLLMNNPEDSVEYKRSMEYKKMFYEDINDYISKRKQPMSGHSVKGRVAAHSWYENMDWHTGLP